MDLYDRIARALAAAPPAGVDAEYLAAFLARNEGELRRLVEANTPRGQWRIAVWPIEANHLQWYGIEDEDKRKYYERADPRAWAWAAEGYNQAAPWALAHPSYSMASGVEGDQMFSGDWSVPMALERLAPVVIVHPDTVKAALAEHAKRLGREAYAVSAYLTHRLAGTDYIGPVWGGSSLDPGVPPKDAWGRMWPGVTAKWRPAPPPPKRQRPSRSRKLVDEDDDG